MFAKKSEYEQEIRKDDINFWKTTNDPVNDSPHREHYGQNNQPPYKNYSGYASRNHGEDGELPGDSAFQPIKRENVNNLWLNNPQEMDFFKNSRGGRNNTSNSGGKGSPGQNYRKLGYR